MEEDLKNQKERSEAQKEMNKSLEEENALLRKRIELQSESLGVSSSLVESLKETLGIRTRQTTSEQNLLKVHKDINRAIFNQKTGLSDIKTVSGQIKKNNDLINKALIQEKSLTEQIGGVNGKISEKDANRIQNVENRNKALKTQSQELAGIMALSKEDRDLEKDRVAELNKLIEGNEKYINTAIGNMSVSAQQLILTKQQREELEKQNILRKKEQEDLKKIEKLLGLTGTLSKSFAKIPGLKFMSSSVDKVSEKLKKASENGEKLPTRFGTFNLILKQTGKDIVKNLTDPLAISALILTQVINIFKKMDALTSGTARNFGISNKQANELNKGLTAAAENTEGLFMTTGNLNASFQEINNRYGTFAKMSNETLATYTKLTKQAGISAETAGVLQDTTYLTNKTLEEQTVEYKGQVKALKATTGLALNEKQILEGIKDISAAIKLQLGGSAEAMATAVFKAKALGLEMKDLESISSSLLSFQSSIEDELAAELLTGKQLNLEGARYAALIGDQAMLAEELAANFGSAAEFGDMNVIQQAALAKSVGLTKDTLAESLMKREAMAALSQFEGDNEKEKYENAVKLYGIEGARQKLGNEALADQMESVSIQEKLAAMGQKFQESFIPIAEKILPYIDKAFTLIGDNIGGIVTAMKVIVPLMLAFKVAAIAASIAQIAGASATTFGAAGVAALIAGGAAYSFLSSVGDLSMPANGPTITDPKEGGIYSMSPNDDIMAGPGLVKDYNTLKNNKASTAGNTQAASAVNITPSDTNITLELNGAVVANTFARDSYSVGGDWKAAGGVVDMSARTVNS